MKIKFLLYVLAAFLSASSAFAEPAPAPESFATAYVSAINSKNAEVLKSLIHSQSLACFVGPNASFLDENTERMFEELVPPGYRVADVIPISSTATLLMESFSEGKFVYPVRPTHRLQIVYNVGPNHDVSLMSEIVLEGNQWKEVLPCPKKGALAWLKTVREEKKEEAARQAKLAEVLVNSMDQAYIGTLAAIAKSGSWLDAVKKIMADKHVDAAMARRAMEIIAPIE